MTNKRSDDDVEKHNSGGIMYSNISLVNYWWEGENVV